MTRVGIIGGGTVGRTLGESWLRSGHDVRFGSRRPEATGPLPAPVDVPHAVATWAEVVVLAVPGRAAAPVVEDLGSALGGRIVIDATNRAGDATLHSLDAIAAAAPDATLCRALSTVGWEVMADPTVGGEQADLFWCGDEPARERVDALIADLGFRPMWIGGRDQAGTVDGVARLWFALALGRGHGRRLAFRTLVE